MAINDFTSIKKKYPSLWRHIFGSLHEFTDVHCVGLDQDVPSLNKCKEGLEFFKELNSGSTIFMQGSVYKLPFEDNTFDAYLVSFGARNFSDINQSLHEARRVLKNNGRLLCLEFSKVQNVNLAKMYSLYIIG